MAPPLLLFLFLLPLLLLSPSTACPPSDRSALLTIRSALSDDASIGVFSSWSGADCCSRWYGVSCDPATGRVAGLVLRGESEDPIITLSGRPGLMTGFLSPDVCRLTGLTSLVLADWKHISGPIPACIPSSLPLLRNLDLPGNRITGALPYDIGRLTRLAVLNLADNLISGQIPRSLPALSSLAHLDLSGNSISGQLPDNFGELAKLSRALMARNRLTGRVPASVGSMQRLADLDLAGNCFSGEIPSGLGGVPVLSSLYLDGNRMTGRIPGSLLASRGLGILNLSGNALEGEIPDVFGRRSYFTALDLSHNRLTGRVPASLSAAAFVGHLDLSYNHLCGPLPAGSPFDHLDGASFSGNDCLCGRPLAACK